MSEWDWFDDYEADAVARGDPERTRVAQLHHAAFRLRETDPDQALALIGEGCQLARQLGEPWWGLFYDHYRVHALLHFKQDYREVLDLAVRNALEVRRPAFLAFPFRLLIHDDLIAAYLGIDPPGFAEPVREALNELAHEVQPETESGYLLVGRRLQLAMDLGAVDEAAQLLQRALAMADADPGRRRARHFSVFLFADACEIAWRRKDWEALMIGADAGEQLAAEVGHRVQQAAFQMWRALLSRRAGREVEAQRLYRFASQRLSRLAMLPEPSSYDAACAFHELAEEGEAMRALRAEQLNRVSGRGMLFYECRCRLDLCRVKARLRVLREEDLVEARAAAGRLLRPEAPLAELRRIASGEGSGP